MESTHKYRPQLLTVNGKELDLPNRKWPGLIGRITPRWCSVDLRDGNQALIEPMTPAAKQKLYDELIRIGIREIEIGFPAASETDETFCRQLIENNRISDDVTLSVLTQCREPQLVKTFETINGAPKAVVHFYNSTSTLQRRVTFGAGRAQILELAVGAAKKCRELEELAGNTNIGYEYSPESFTGTELDYAVDVCDAVIEALGDPSGGIIINLPATVEHQPPSMYADAVEWFCEHLANRAQVTISVHPHNDRGCAVAAAEAAVAAGAERVEGTLFGNGERTGNVDLITLAGNLHTWGYDPGIDLSNVEQTRAVAEECTGIDVHPRHPYAGDLAWVAFSGSHQDAIDKGLRALDGTGTWEVPYLVADPGDFGRGYEPIIRINSQSGRGGVRHIIAAQTGHKLPTGLAAELAGNIQRHTEDSGSEISAAQIASIYQNTYVKNRNIKLGKFETGDDENTTTLEAHWTTVDEEHHSITSGNGPVEAFVDALEKHYDTTLDVIDYQEEALGEGTGATAVSYVEMRNGEHRAWGVGEASSTTRAALQAVCVAAGKLLHQTG